MSSHGQHGSITDHIALLRTHPTGEQRLEVGLRVAGRRCRRPLTPPFLWQILQQHLPRAVEIYEATLKEHAAQRAVGEMLTPPRAAPAPVSVGGNEAKTGGGTLAGV